MWVTLQISMPVLGVSLVVGLLVSIFQAVTQLQEPTLTFIPKILAVVVVIVVAGPWMLNTMLGFTIELWAGIPLDRHRRLAPVDQLLAQLAPQAALFMLIATRLSAMFVVAPIFSSRMIPARVKAGHRDPRQLHHPADRRRRGRHGARRASSPSPRSR